MINAPGIREADVQDAIGTHTRTAPRRLIECGVIDRRGETAADNDIKRLITVAVYRRFAGLLPGTDEGMHFGGVGVLFEDVRPLHFLLRGSGPRGGRIGLYLSFLRALSEPLRLRHCYSALLPAGAAAREESLSSCRSGSQVGAGLHHRFHH